jgi:hypothetical protein
MQMEESSEGGSNLLFSCSSCKERALGPLVWKMKTISSSLSVGRSWVGAISWSQCRTEMWQLGVSGMDNL